MTKEDQPNSAIDELIKKITEHQKTKADRHSKFNSLKEKSKVLDQELSILKESEVQRKKELTATVANNVGLEKKLESLQSNLKLEQASRSSLVITLQSINDKLNHLRHQSASESEEMEKDYDLSKEVLSVQCDKLSHVALWVAPTMNVDENENTV